MLWEIFLLFCMLTEGFCCNNGWHKYEGRCYKASQNMYSVAMAKRYCLISGGQLAHVNSTSLLSFISTIPEYNSINDYWIGEDSAIPVSESTITHSLADSETEPYHTHANATPLPENLCRYARILRIDTEYCTEKKFFLCETTYPDNPNTCPPGYDYHGTHCYRAITSAPATYEDAVKYCILQKTKLATLESEEKEWEAKSVILGEKDIFLVAAKKYDGILKWTDEILFNPIHDLFANSSDGDCVGFLSEPEHPLVFSWAHMDCEQKSSFLCEADTINPKQDETTTNPASTTSTADPLTCPHGYNWKAHEESGYCFWETTYETDRLNWFQAREFCKLYGGDLASYSNKEQEVLGVGGAHGHFRGLWIGLKRDEYDVFHWTDGSTLNFSNWDYDEPKLKSNTKYCVSHSSGSAMWELDYCGVRRWFVCKAPKVKTTVLPDTSSLRKSKKCDIKDVSIYSSYWYEFEDHCYLIQDKGSYTWDTGRYFCQDNGGHMASVHSFEETNFILALMSGYPSTNFWIGLSAQGLQSSYEWSDKTALDFIYWSDNKSEAGDMNSCVEFNKADGSWNNNHCNRLQGVICKRGINATYDFTSTEPAITLPGNCENGWYSLANKCYKFFGTLWSQRMSWDDANKDCESNGASLASIHNQEEQDFLTDIVLEAATDVWIGLKAIERGTIFHWSDSTRMDYTSWKPNNPEFHSDLGSYMDSGLYSESFKVCVEMEFNEPTMGKWNDISCDRKKGYMCQKMKDPTNTMPYQDPFDCPNITGWYKLGSSCYGLFDQYNMTWLEAQGECKKYRANLISYKNVAVSLYINKKLKMKNVKNAYFWIGVREKMPDTYEYVTGHSLFYANWMSGQPRAASKLLDNCVSTTEYGAWLVKSCKEKNPFLCELKKETGEVEPKIDRTHTCTNLTGNWHDFGGDHCYMYETEMRLSWIDAMHYCFRHGGYLASFHSANDISTFSKNLMYFNKPPSLHIGLGKKKDGSFAWVDNTPLDFTNWDEGEPEEGDRECVEMNMRNGKWNAIDCESNFRGFVCSSRKLSATFEANLLQNASLDSDIIRKKLTVGGIFGILTCITVVAVIVGMVIYYLRPKKEIQPRLLETDAL